MQQTDRITTAFDMHFWIEPGAFTAWLVTALVALAGLAVFLFLRSRRRRDGGR